MEGHWYVTGGAIIQPEPGGCNCEWNWQRCGRGYPGGVLSPSHFVSIQYNQSLVDSSISTRMNENSGSTNDDGGVLGEETDTAILQMVAEDEAEEGDGGDSDVEGGEINLHNEAMMAIDRWVDELNRSLDNDLDFGELDEAFEQVPPTIPGAPNGWTPPGPPENYRGYLPKLDAGAPLLFSEVDNPDGWSEFVFQPKSATEWGYAISEKGCSSGYGHEFKLMTKQELVRWLGVTIRHGARDGNAGTHHRRWLTDDVDYDLTYCKQYDIDALVTD